MIILLILLIVLILLILNNKEKFVVQINFRTIDNKNINSILVDNYYSLSKEEINNLFIFDDIVIIDIPNYYKIELIYNNNDTTILKYGKQQIKNDNIRNINIIKENTNTNINPNYINSSLYTRDFVSNLIPFSLFPQGHANIR